MIYDADGHSVDVSAYGKFTLSGTTLNWNAVPEPASYGLAAIGLLAAGVAGRTRRRKAAVAS